MITKLIQFIRREDGAVTVDWVVLTAMVVGLAGLAITSLQSSTGALGSSVGNYVANQDPS